MRNFFLIITAFVLLLPYSKAQNASSFYPFKGFHIGRIVQAEFIQPGSFVAFTGTDPARREQKRPAALKQVLNFPTILPNISVFH